MINLKINNQILDLWQKYFKENNDVYAPLFYDEHKTGGILFVGVNPSFTSKGYQRILKDTEYENVNPEEFFKWKTISSDPKLIDAFAAIEQLWSEKYPTYFKPMNNISKEVGLPYQHADIFLYKQTAQNEFVKLVMEKGNKLNEFGKDQLAIFLQILNNIQPKVIVVANAFASRIIKENLKEKLSFDEKCGFHRLSLNGDGVPIFFSSMLTGQRALDTGSYERLLWHIRQAVKA